jgi:hypothetical protein
MTSLEWVVVKKRLSAQENAISKTLAGVPRGPRYVACDDDTDRNEPTLRGSLCEQLAEIQQRRKTMKPTRHRR